MAKILVVDDRRINRQFLQTLLGYSNHQVLEAADGAEALKLARAYDELQRHAVQLELEIGERRQAEKRLAAQHAATRALAESATLEEASPKILRAICESLGWDLGEIWKVDARARLLRCVEIQRQPSFEAAAFEMASRDFTFAPEVGLPGRVWSSRQPAWITDVSRDDNFPRALPAVKSGLHGAIAFPILAGTEVLGVIQFLSREILHPDSEPGSGTTFKIYLPRVEGAAEAVAVEKAMTGSLRGSETILLVEDEAGVRKLARRILESNGYTVLQADNAEQATVLSKQHKRPIDLLLTDIVLTDVSGPKLADQLHSTRSDMKALYMSGYTDEAVVRTGMLNASSAFVQKPFTPELLLRKVREALG